MSPSGSQGRALLRIRSAWPSGAPGYALLGLVLAGLLLRLVTIASWWPVSTTLADGYELAANTPLHNPLHPAGYSLLLASLGLVTHEVAVPVLLQHLSGIASALLLWAATRRVSGSEWAGLLPAGVVLLDPDFIFLEHSIMSESLLVLGIAVALYAAVRSLDEPDPWWRWPLLAGVALGLSVMVRNAPLLMVPVLALAVLLWRPGSLRSWGVGWKAALAMGLGCVAILLPFAVANATIGDRFGLGASPGWYLYARAAQFADCERFTPPPGTAGLCESRPPDERPGASYYIVDPQSPARRHIGVFGTDDGLVGSWARRAVLAQPGDYLESVWQNLRGYWVPGARPDRPGSGDELDPQLSFTSGLDDSGDYPPAQVPIIELAFERALETYYNDFSVHLGRPGLQFLRAWQQALRFGATALSIATLLVLVGLCFGTRRSRVGVLVFGVGGLSLIVAPALTANYFGRYTVPMAAPLAAAAAITLVALWRLREGAPTRGRHEDGRASPAPRR